MTISMNKSVISTAELALIDIRDAYVSAGIITCTENATTVEEIRSNFTSKAVNITVADDTVTININNGFISSYLELLKGIAIKAIPMVAALKAVAACCHSFKMEVKDLIKSFTSNWDDDMEYIVLHTEKCGVHTAGVFTRIAGSNNRWHLEESRSYADNLPMDLVKPIGKYNTTILEKEANEEEDLRLLTPNYFTSEADAISFAKKEVYGEE